MTNRVIPAVSLALVIISGACANSDGDPSVAPAPVTSPSPSSARYLPLQTNDPRVPLVVADTQEGTLLGGVVGGGVAFLHGGDRIVVLPNADGLPSRLIVDGVVFLFENYTATTVDVGMIAGAQSQIVRRVPIDAAQVAELRAFASSPSTASARLWRPAADLSIQDRRYWKTIALIANIGSCAASYVVATAGGPIGFLVASQLVLACSSALIAIVSDVLPPQWKETVEGTDALKTLLEFGGCLLPSAVQLVQCFATSIDTAVNGPEILNALEAVKGELEELLKELLGEPADDPTTPIGARHYQGSFVAAGTHTIGSCVWQVVDDFKEVRVALQAPPDNSSMWGSLRTTIGPLISGSNCVPYGLTQERTTYAFLKVTASGGSWRFETFPAVSGQDQVIFNGTASTATATGTYARTNAGLSVSGEFSLGSSR